MDFLKLVLHECSLPSLVRKYNKLIGHHVCSRDVMDQSYPVYTCTHESTRADHSRYPSVHVTFRGGWVHSLLERFSIECRKTKTKVITLANHRGHRQSSEPIKTRSNYMKLTQSAGKRVRVSQDWFWFYF